MVAEQIRARGVRSPHVVRAMGRVRREFFVPPSQTDRAYDDGPLPIGDGQTISQPFIVAFMVEALDLRGGERVLEIGTGSGYAAAVLAEIAGDVFTVERNARLAEEAGERLRRHGYRNVHVTHGDGTLGLPAAAPFDAILVSAGGPRVPESLRGQLGDGGRLVIPIGEDLEAQRLVRVTRVAHRGFREEDLGEVRFVPLIGTEGWRADDRARD
jgi:protein-L-isoaspartate(D-aspartate) O-methyltransferase